MVAVRSYKLFQTRQFVVSKYEPPKIVGFEKENNKPDGWQFDIKRWSSIFDMKLPSLPKLSDFKLQGLQESEYFQSGVLDNSTNELKVESIEEQNINYEKNWSPFLNSGNYFRYNTKFYYFSDRSIVQYINPLENINNKNVVYLNKEPSLIHPIIAAVYKRDVNTRVIDYYKYIKQSYKFTGIYINEEEQNTVSDSGMIYWNNVDFTKREFLIDSTRQDNTLLIFNRDYTKTFGKTPNNYNDLDLCEYLGSSNGSNYQVFYLKYFPVLASDFKLYIADNNSYEEWERCDSWFELLTTESTYNQKRYFLDTDLGIVYFSDKINKPKLGSFIYCKYTTTVRVEYEKEENTDFSILPFTANLNPLSQYINQGFVCITHNKLDADGISLEINKDLIPFSNNPKIYGPVTIGNDSAILKATVVTDNGIPVPGVEVKFELTPNNIGYLNGAVESYSVTNSKGEAYTTYQPPSNTDDIGFYITSIRTSTNPSYTSHKDIIISDKNSVLVGNEDNVYIYQILKDDLIFGYDNLNDYIDDNYTPPAWVYNTDPVIQAANILEWKNELKLKYGLKDWDETNGLTGVKPDGTIDGRKVILYKTVAATYKTTEPKGIINNGTDNYSSTAINPITGETGAIVPIKPVLIEVIEDESDEYNGYTRLIYEEDAVPDPNPTDSNNNIAAYWVVSRKTISFKASCLNIRYNKYIYSNDIYTAISLPNYLLGEYISENLGNIPYGWKLIEENNNFAAALNGATFLTVNPSYGPYEIIDIINGTSTNTWASAPFRSISFLVTI